MPKRKSPLDKRVVRAWMAEQAKTYKEPTWIANLASAKFEIYHTPKWLDLMAAEAVDDAEK